MARDLAQKYKLEGVYVAYVGRKAKSDFSLRHTARVAALALHDIINPGTYWELHGGDNKANWRATPKQGDTQYGGMSSNWLDGIR